MHIPDGMLTVPVWSGLMAVSAAGLGYALRRTNRDLDETRVPLLGVTAAFVFAAQMVNVPIATGVSAHFTGSALVAIVLGPWAGMVVLSAVLLIQCFGFQDGGVTALGANFFNMGILGVGAAWGVHRAASVLLPARWGRPAGAFAAAWVSCLLCACACGLELGLSGAVPTGLAVGALGAFHAVSGLFEAAVTVSAVGFLQRVRPEVLSHLRSNEAGAEA